MENPSKQSFDEVHRPSPCHKTNVIARTYANGRMAFLRKMVLIAGYRTPTPLSIRRDFDKFKGYMEPLQLSIRAAVLNFCAFDGRTVVININFFLSSTVDSRKSTEKLFAIIETAQNCQKGPTVLYS